MRSYHHLAAARIVLVLTILAGLLPLHAHGAPEIGASAPASAQSVAANVALPTPSIAPDGTFRLNVAVTTAAPAEYLEIRVRLRGPSGRLIYQKTEVRSGLSAGTTTVAYEHDMDGLRLEQGRYPIEVRVLATGADPTTVTTRLLVVDPEAEPLPVAVVVVPTGLPYVTMSGALSGDPALDTRLRDDLAVLAQLASDDALPLALALPPVLTEQLARVSAGYETTAGVVVPASDETPVRYSHVLDSLRSEIGTGTIELLDVPYGLPDLAALTSIGGATDIELHWRETDTVNTLVRLTGDGPRVAYLGRSLSVQGLAAADSRGAVCVIAHEGALRSEDATAAPGCYAVSGATTKVLIADQDAAASVKDGPEAFYDAVFERMDGGPVVVILEVGPGSPHTTADVRSVLDWLGTASWLELAEISSLARPARAKSATIDRRPDGPENLEYWTSVAAARSAALAYAKAVGPDDNDGAAVVRALLTAESSLVADRPRDGIEQTQGLARSAEALEYVTSQFSLIRLDAKDVTLSGTRGDIPLTLVNDTSKPLDLQLRTASGTQLTIVSSQDIVAQPTQNFFTLPVDLGNALSDEISLGVYAGDVRIAEARVGVRASYVDRLATILLVILVLAVLLVIIKRKVGSPVADTILRDSHGTQPASREK